MDWTPILTAVIGILGSLLAYAWQRHIKPWLDSKRLTDAAQIAVSAVESLFASYKGEQKFEEVLKKLAEKGFNVKPQAVQDAIEAAWYQMNISQVAAGLKDKPPDEA